ncbi:hypothetical protein CRI94_07310 [Longibacter salinarum]|uniref:Uncharacterized protein n=1 Tax=Longibacter salinarum TaxID=1850348 RepID=A0A2A8CZ34_9BACT|nr:hypothetical protein [Longibacter salinarum]PEN13861.1 hypothetical protein CRI94_07310 [Longibacter salinarum]
MYFDEALNPDETAQNLLYVLFTAALDHQFEAEQAQAFGIWTLCYVQFCRHKDVPADAPHLPGFLSFLRNHPEVTSEEKDRALDAIMFALFDVFNGRIDPSVADQMVAHEEEDNHAGSTRPKTNGQDLSQDTASGGRLLTRLLFHTDLSLSEAVRLTAGDVDVERALLRVGPKGSTRVIPLPDHLRAEVNHQARSLRSSENGFGSPLFPAAYDKYVSSSPSSDDDKQAATRVMQTLFLT